MKLSNFDWPFLRRHTLRPTLCAALASAALVGAYFVQQHQYRQYVNLVANQEAVHEDYDNLLRQRQIVDRYHRRYQQFNKLGFVGEESRLDWVEYMRTTTSTLALPALNYAIEPQVAVASPLPPSDTGDEIEVRVSKMQLEVALVHEMDLLRLFDALQSKAPGLIKVDSCGLTLIGAGISNVSEPGISANCELQLYSVITSDVRRGGI